MSPSGILEYGPPILLDEAKTLASATEARALSGELRGEGGGASR